MLVTRMVTKIVDANWCSMDRKDSGRDFDRAIGGGGGGGVGLCFRSVLKYLQILDGKDS